MLDQMHSISGTTFEEDGASLPGLMRQFVRGERDDKKMKTEKRENAETRKTSEGASSGGAAFCRLRFLVSTSLS